MYIYCYHHVHYKDLLCLFIICTHLLPSLSEYTHMPFGSGRSFTTHEFRARAFCIVSLNFLAFSLSPHFTLLMDRSKSWDKVSHLRLCQLCFWIVCGINHRVDGKWFQWLMAHPAKILASKQSSHYVCTMWCSEFGLSSWETNVSLSWMHCNFYLGTLFHGSHGLWPIFTVAAAGKRKAKLTLPCFCCWPCKYPCQICFTWFGRTYHRQFKHGILSWESLILGRQRCVKPIPITRNLVLWKGTKNRPRDSSKAQK